MSERGDVFMRQLGSGSGGSDYVDLDDWCDDMLGE